MSDDAWRRIDALIQVGIRLARSATSGRVLLARVADALDPLLIPRPWGDTIIAELDAARANAREPLDVRQVERALREAWGVRPTEELDDFDPEPAAVTPTSQVHRAVLEGSPVAVKVLRPGLAASVRRDLALLEGLLSPLGSAFPSLDPGAVVREFRERVLDEFDLENEAAAQRRFHRALRNHPFLTVPAPITRLAHQGVLVSEWVQGAPLGHASDPDEAAARLVVFVVGAARAGVMHADPDPDDVLVMADGRLAILDFGATREVQPERVELTAAAVEAFVADDAEGFGAAARALGVLPSSLGPDALELARHVLGELAAPEPVRLDSEAILGARDRLFASSDALVALLLSGALPPQDVWPARGIAQLFGTIATVGADGAWRELIRAALRDGWSATTS